MGCADGGGEMIGREESVRAEKRSGSAGAWLVAGRSGTGAAAGVGPREKGWRCVDVSIRRMGAGCWRRRTRAEVIRHCIPRSVSVRRLRTEGNFDGQIIQELERRRSIAVFVTLGDNRDVASSKAWRAEWT
jgi:hypothetical protein